MFFDKDGNVVENKDPKAGLYVKTRKNEKIHLQFNDHEKYLAFQVGETSQILSGGALVATPHAVMGASEDKYKGVFVFFLQCFCNFVFFLSFIFFVVFFVCFLYFV